MVKMNLERARTMLMEMTCTSAPVLAAVLMTYISVVLEQRATDHLIEIMVRIVSN